MRHISSGRAHKETRVKSQTALRVAVTIDTGRLSDVGYLTDQNTIACHPNTGVRFGGIEIPSIQACAALAVKLHSQFPSAECLGWDLAVDEKGVPHVLEWNDGHGAHQIRQCGGRSFRIWIGPTAGGICNAARQAR